VNSLVISTTVWVVNRVHGHTGNMWVELTTGLGLVVSGTGCTHWHLVSAMAGENTDGGSAVSGKFLQSARWHTNTNLVANAGFNHAGVASGTSDLATVAGTELEVVDRRTFRDVPQFSDVPGTERHIVADGDLASNGEAFGRCDQRRVAVRRLDAGERSAVNGAVNQFGDLAHHVFVAWHTVLSGESVAGHAVAWRGTFALCTNSLTHGKSPQNAPRRMAASSAS